MKRDLIITASRSLLILLFFYASVSKLVDIPLFKRQMEAQPFPHWLALSFMVLVPLSEIVLAVLLMIEATSKKALLASSILMALFTLYIGAILLNFFGRIPCSCGGVIQKLDWPQHLIFNIIFLTIAISGYLSARQPVNLKRKSIKLSV